MNTRNQKKLLKYALTLLAIFAVIKITDYYLYTQALNNPITQDKEKTEIILIKKGSSAKKIAEILEEKKLIKKARYFKRYIKNIEAEKKLLPGRFELKNSLTIPEITEILADPKKAGSFITIPEGKDTAWIDDELANMNLIKKGEFLKVAKNFEGYLFPDTYFLDTGNFTPESLIKMMRKNFQKKIAQEKIAPEKLNKIIIIASLLEKEVKTKKDLGIVSGIIWKRLENGWFLNIDATLLYGKKTNIITKNDLEESSPYNTYKNKGLPPSPIGNPGIKTIRAAANPENSPYWFYLTKPETGEVVYAKTNDEQNSNRAKYLK